MKIYNYHHYYLWNYSGCGPNFSLNGTILIAIDGNPLKTSTLKTNENNFKNIFIEDNALSEDGRYGGIYAIDYEVFQIIF